MNCSLFFAYLITNIITNYILFGYLSERYNKKHSKYCNLIVFIISSIIVSLINILNIPVLNLIVSLLNFSIISVLFYKHYKFHEYCHDMIYLLVLIFLDSLSFFIVGFIYSSPKDILIFRIMSSALVLLLFNMIIKKYISYTKIENVPIREIIVYFIITLFYIFLIYILSRDYDLIKEQFSKTVIIFIVIAHVFIDIIIYHYLNFVGIFYKLEKEMLEANKQEEIKNLYYTNLRKNYDENRKIIHDFKNHLQILEHTYKHNFEKASKIKNEIINDLNNQTIKYKSSSEILDMILYDKEREANKHNICFDFKMEIIDLSFISDIDIITIFGNLYDNAIEANICDFDYKYINTSIYQIKQTIIIRIENSCINHLSYSGRKIRSTKNNHSGLGLNNIKRKLENYDGFFNISIQDNKCIVIISIPIKS